MVKKYYRVKCTLRGWLNCYYDYDQNKFSMTEAISDFIYEVADGFQLKASNITVETVELVEV
ncbi:TPA: hypothetical protein ACGO6P_000420 [Streptococcus suis]